MKEEWLKTLVGDIPLPRDLLERSKLLEFADSHHVLGQMAATWSDEVSGKTRDVMENGLYRASFDHRMLKFEMDRIERALEGSGIEPILLKGASYVAKGLRAGAGRRVSDIDILVPEEELAETERLLLAAGWVFDEATDNEYDQNYYRKHMHELPPLRHNHRRTVIDVHHRILPRTSRIEVNTDAFIRAAKPIDGRRLRAFNNIDRFLHSAIHTFSDGSFDTPARSLVELKYLLSDIDPKDDEGLLERAHIVGAEQSLSLALWVLYELFDDDRAWELSKKFKVGTNFIVRWAISSKLRDVSNAKPAKLALYIRSHYLRMPLPKLIWHIMTKGYRRLRKPPVLPLPPGFE
ncbi:MAG: nucleotidyltransferase family protein [Kordiimonas sp.]